MFIASKEASIASQCLKIPEKVKFNIASEESYVYILSGQKLIKNWQNIIFENLKPAVKQCFQTSQFITTKKIENVKVEKLNCDIMRDFQVLCALISSL